MSHAEFNLDAERYALGAALLESECIEKLASIVDGSDFSKAHGLIYRRLLD